VQRRCVQHDVDTLHAAAHESAVGDRTYPIGKRTGANVDTDGLATSRPQGTDQRLAEMAGTAGHQNCHAS